MSDPASDDSRREALRGAEANTLDLIFEVLTSEQRAEWLKALLELAVTKGERDLAQRLLRAGARIGDALHNVVDGGYGEIVSDLLENGASPAAKSTQGRAPLRVAAEWGQTEMVQLLLMIGEDNDALDNEEYSPLSLAAYSGQIGSHSGSVGCRCGRQPPMPSAHVPSDALWRPKMGTSRF